MKALLTLIIAFFTVSVSTSYAKSFTHFTSDSLPPQLVLFQSLKGFHQAKTASQLAEYNIKEKYNWMRWSPQLGVMYNLQGQPRPTLSFSLDKIYANVRDKSLRTAKSEALQLAATIEFKTDSLNLLSLLKKYDILKLDFATIEAMQQVDDALWELTKRKFNANEITPTQYLIEKREYLHRAETYAKAKTEIELLEIEVLKLSKW